MTESMVISSGVLLIGKAPISSELCGGTHAGSTGELGFFQIIATSGIGAGLRRNEVLRAM